MNNLPDVDLKPCPFCGHREYLTTIISGSAIMVHCQNCDAVGPAHLDDCDDQGAFDLWNKRTQEDKP